MKKTPEIGRYLDDEEKALVQAFETGDAPVKRGLTPKRKRDIEAMARATMTDARAKISLRVPKRDQLFAALRGRPPFGAVGAGGRRLLGRSCPAGQTSQLARHPGAVAKNAVNQRGDIEVDVQRRPA